MAEAEIVFETDEGQLFALLPDVVVREEHRNGSDATEQEVERGISVTDHVKERAPVVTLECVFSDSPIRTIRGEPDQFFFGVEGAPRALELTAASGPVLEQLAKAGPPARGIRFGEGSPSLPSANAWQPDGEVTRTVDSWALLRAAQAGKWLALIVTELETYESMVLVDFECSKTAQDGTWIRVPMTFRQLRQVSTQLVDAAEPVRPRDRAQVNQGSQPTEPVSEELASAAYQALDELGIHLGPR